MREKRLLRRVRMVEEQPVRRRSKVAIFGFGYEALARLVKRSVVTVKRHERVGEFDMERMGSVVNYVASMRLRNMSGVVEE